MRIGYLTAIGVTLALALGSNGCVKRGNMTAAEELGVRPGEVISVGSKQMTRDTKDLFLDLYGREHPGIPFGRWIYGEARLADGNGDGSVSDEEFFKYLGFKEGMGHQFH